MSTAGFTAAACPVFGHRTRPRASESLTDRLDGIVETWAQSHYELAHRTRLHHHLHAATPTAADTRLAANVASSKNETKRAPTADAANYSTTTTCLPTNTPATRSLSNSDVHPAISSATNVAHLSDVAWAA